MNAPQERYPQSLAPNPELAELLGLRRVASRGVALHRDAHYLDRGKPMPDFHSDALDKATVAGLVHAEPLDYVHGTRRLHLTTVGTARLVALEEQLRVIRTSGTPAPPRRGCSGPVARPATISTAPLEEVAGRALTGVWTYHEDDERDHALNVYAERATGIPPIARCGLVLTMRLLDPQGRRSCQPCLTHIEIEEKILAQAEQGDAMVSAWDSDASSG